MSSRWCLTRTSVRAHIVIMANTCSIMAVDDAAEPASPRGPMSLRPSSRGSQRWQGQVGRGGRGDWQRITRHQVSFLHNVGDERAPELIAAAKRRHPASMEAVGATNRWSTDDALVAHRSPDSRQWAAGRRRGRRRLHTKAGAFVCLIAFLVLLALPVRQLAATAPPVPKAQLLVSHSLYTVRPGDTLWSIATRLVPDGDPRPIVAELASETGSAGAVVGERLVLP